MNLKYWSGLIAIVAAFALVFVRGTDLDARLAAHQKELDAALNSRAFHIDPAELLGLTVNSSVRLQLLDVRPEADFNLFHIIDSRHVSLNDLSDPEWSKSLMPDAVTILISNDEARAETAWRTLRVQGVPQLYILAGGVNFWLDIYGAHPREDAATAHVEPGGPDTFRHSFDLALGAAQLGADPDPAHTPTREYQAKVELSQPGRKKSGGCG